MAQVADGSLLEMDQLIHSRCLRVRSRRTDDITVDIISLNIRLDGEVHEIVRLVHGVIPAFSGDQVLPVLGQELTIHSRCHICRDHCRLDGEGAASAERVHEDPVALPRGQHDESRRQRLRDRCFTRQCAVAALMQGLAGGVESHCHRVLVKEDTEREARAVFRKPLDPVRLFHPLHHGFFHDGLDVRRTEKLALDGGRLCDPEFRVLREIFLPRDRAGSLEQILEGLRVEAADF